MNRQNELQAAYENGIITAAERDAAIAQEPTRFQATDFAFSIDTAGSWDAGAHGFPIDHDDDLVVEIEDPYTGEPAFVHASARYTGWCSDADAATAAVEAYTERYGDGYPPLRVSCTVLDTSGKLRAALWAVYDQQAQCFENTEARDV